MAHNTGTKRGKVRLYLGCWSFRFRQLPSENGVDHFMVCLRGRRRTRYSAA
ncbi:hypothetical protein ARZXY2_4526 (plasmid) [Arthrobacter sp. ZXY-2]|nr:hypothetical protein ARZXY2_4526 [Arthrobacter sp. ZXY-2]